MAKVIGLVNQKGGCGKSTTAVNLAAGLAMSGKRVLFIDCDPQTNSSMTLVGLEKLAKMKTSLYDVFASAARRQVFKTGLKDVWVETSIDNLTLVPAKPDLAGVEVELVSKVGREVSLKKQIDLVKNDFDFIILDSPPNLGLITLNVIVASDDLIIPVQTHPYAMLGMNLLLSTVDMIREDLGAEVNILGIVPTMYDERINICKDALDAIKEEFGSKVTETLIHSNSKVIESSASSPVIIFEPSSRGAKEYMDLCEEVLAYYGEPKQQKGSNKRRA